MSVVESALVRPDGAVPNDLASRRTASVGWREVALFAVALVALVVIELLVLRATPAITRPLWLDEIHTYLLAGTQSVGESMRSLASGADYNPPTLYLLYRVVGLAVGGLSEVTMRIVALTSVLGALVVTYRLLRESFERGPAALAILTTWANPVVVNVAFDARFYGPWLFGAAWLVFEATRRLDGRPTGALGAVRLAVASLFVCTIHYFGILSLAAVAIVAILRTGLRHSVRTLLPAVVGPIALVFCLPLYRGQRAALTVGTWIPDPTIGDILFLLVVVLLPVATAVALGAWALNAGLLRLTKRRDTSVGSAIGIASFLLAGQVIVPLTLAVFSLAVLPATQPRYWIVGALAMAPFVARAFANAGGVAPLAAIAVLVCSVSALKSEGDVARLRARVVAEDIDQIDRLTPPGSLIVTRRRHSLYPLLRARPDLAPRLAYLDATPAAPTDRFSIVERDAGRAHARIYGFPRIQSTEDLRETKSFYLIELDPTQSPTAHEFPNDTITRIGPRFFRLDRR